MGRCGEPSSFKPVRYTSDMKYTILLWGHGAIGVKARLWRSAALQGPLTTDFDSIALQEISWDHPYLPKESYFTCEFFSARKVR